MTYAEKKKWRNIHIFLWGVPLPEVADNFCVFEHPIDLISCTFTRRQNSSVGDGVEQQGLGEGSGSSSMYGQKKALVTCNHHKQFSVGEVGRQ